MCHQQTGDTGKLGPALHGASQERTKCSVCLGSDFTINTILQEGTMPLGAVEQSRARKTSPSFELLN